MTSRSEKYERQEEDYIGLTSGYQSVWLEWNIRIFWMLEARLDRFSITMLWRTLLTHGLTRKLLSGTLLNYWQNLKKHKDSINLKPHSKDWVKECVPEAGSVRQRNRRRALPWRSPRVHEALDGCQKCIRRQYVLGAAAVWVRVYALSFKAQSRHI